MLRAILSAALLTLAKNHYAAAKVSFAESCEVKLRVAGLWEAAPWSFAPEAESASTSHGQHNDDDEAQKSMRVVWIHQRAQCYTNHSFLSPEVGTAPPPAWQRANCEPIPEWDFVWRELLAQAPLAGQPMWAPAASQGFGGHGGALIAGDYFTLADKALYVVHLAPWTTITNLHKLELLGRALHTCHSQRALLHLCDESGVIDHVYQLWPLIIRPYYSEILAQRWNESNKVLFTPIGYGSGFWQRSLAERQRGGPHDLVDGTCRRRNSNDKCDDNCDNERGVDGVNKLASRSFDWVFVGNGRKRARPAQLRALSDAMPVHALISSTGFLGRGAVGLGSVARPLMEDAVFCPIPCGFEHPDSFRFAEALEVGCLPLVGACEADDSDTGESNANAESDNKTPPPPRAQVEHGAYFRAYAAYAESAFGAPPMGSLSCAYADLANQSWGCPSVPAALLWHSAGGGRKNDWPMLAGVAADSLRELRGDGTSNGGEDDEEDPLITVQRDLVLWWRGLKKSLAHEIGARLNVIMA